MPTVKYNGEDMRRAYGVEMRHGDTHEFTDEQAAHLTRLPEFEVVDDGGLGDLRRIMKRSAKEEIEKGLTDRLPAPLPHPKPIAKTASKKKK